MPQKDHRQSPPQAEPHKTAQKNRLLGVVSDTHGQLACTRKAARMLDSLDVDVVLHCGDIGSAEIPLLLQAWRTHYVLGNVDRPSAQMLAAIEAASGVFHGRFGSLAAAGRQIAFLHGDDVSRLDREIASGKWDLLCHGHTHKAKLYKQGETLVLNPGAMQRAWPPSIAVVELELLRVTLIPME